MHSLADEIRIFEGEILIASHVPLEGRDQKRLDPAHRRAINVKSRRATSPAVHRAGDQVARRPLSFYDAVARRLAGRGGSR